MESQIGCQMIDPLTSLSFALYSNKGAYALLIGSGVSSAAQIPTGYSIVTDLIRKIARVRNEDCEPDPEAWWKERTGKGPDYSELLNHLAKPPAERQGILKQYFEPTLRNEMRAQRYQRPRTKRLRGWSLRGSYAL
jgi:hypothetical protein